MSALMVLKFGISVLILLQLTVAEAENAYSKRGRLIFPTQFLSSTTNTIFVISTITKYPSCVAGAAVITPCVKRKRRNFNIDFSKVDRNRELDIDSSQKLTAMSPETSVIQKEGKFLRVLSPLAIWTTFTLTTSVTVISTNISSRLSMSFVCSAPGMVLPAAC